MDEIAKIYERVILDSQDNVRRLKEKLADIDMLYAEIADAKNDIANIPDAFKTRLDQVVVLAEKHLKDVGDALEGFLASVDKRLNVNLESLGAESVKLMQEIDRLVVINEELRQVDFRPMFEVLRQEFIAKARQDIAVELKKFENETSRLQEKVNVLNTEVTRLSEIDLEKHFNSLQSTLAALSGSVAQINLNLNTIASSLGEILTKQTNLHTALLEESAGVRKLLSDNNISVANRLDELTTKQIILQKTVSDYIGNLEDKIEQEKHSQEKRHVTLVAMLSEISEDNRKIMEGQTLSRVIVIVGIVITAIVLAVVVMIKWP